MTLFDEDPVVRKIESWKSPSITPFDFIKAINETKESLIVDEWSEKQYNSYLVNKGLSFGKDTIYAANAMNSRPHLDKALQFYFFINIIRQRKRFNKWIKPEKIEAIEVIKEYYGYSTEKAYQVLSIFNDEKITTMKNSIYKGGRDVR